MEQVDYKVCITCFTYNQALYIEEALNGFCMQETDFPFVCAVVDDASTDGEPEVIKKYLQEHFDLEDRNVVRNEETDDYIKIFARHKTNTNCFFVVLFLKYNHYRIGKDKIPYFSKWRDSVKYQATCEGDDYWIDSYKLQKQIDFLETHPDYVLCCHETQRYNQTTGEMYFTRHKVLERYPAGFSFDSKYDGWNYDGWLTQTLTNVYRTDYKGKDVFLSMKKRYDVIFNFFITRAGKCFLMPDVMSVYRIHKLGMCSGTPFVTFYLNILSAFQELNQKVRSHEARVVLQRHLRVNIGNLILLRQWSVIIQSIKTISAFSPLYEYVFFILVLPIHGFCQITKIMKDVLKNKFANIYK